MADVPRLEWRPVKGWPYEASSMGDVRRSSAASGTRPGRVLRQHPNKQGYLRVCLSRSSHGQLERRSMFVHRLVLSAFRGTSPDRYAVNHKNADPSDNRLENLEWATAQENLDHAKKMGLLVVGERNHASKVTAGKVAEIRDRYMQGETQRSLAAVFGVSYQAIGQIVRRETWKHLP